MLSATKIRGLTYATTRVTQCQVADASGHESSSLSHVLETVHSRHLDGRMQSTWSKPEIYICRAFIMDVHWLCHHHSSIRRSAGIYRQSMQQWAVSSWSVKEQRIAYNCHLVDLWNGKFASLVHSVITIAFGPKQVPYSSIIELDRRIRDFHIPSMWKFQCEDEASDTNYELRIQRYFVIARKEIGKTIECLMAVVLTTCLHSFIESPPTLSCASAFHKACWYRTA